MATNEILRATVSLNNDGSKISTKMVDFLNNVSSQPIGFRELGLDFLGICKITEALKESLETHIQTNQPFPERAVPEIMRIIATTSADFKKLDMLLQKFIDYEAGGAVGKLQKTWRMFFADKDVAKVRNSLRENQAAIRMTMLLTDMYATLTSDHLPFTLTILETPIHSLSTSEASIASLPPNSITKLL